MSFLSEQFAIPFEEVHGYVKRDTTCSLNGRSFSPVSGRTSYEKKPADAGFIAGIDAVFVALNSEIVGLNLRQTVGKVLTFKNETFNVRRFEEGGLTTYFYCEAKNA